MNDIASTHQTIFNRDNITLAIALFGALGTALSGILSFFRSRKKISIQIIKICRLEEFMIAYIAMQNKSRLPISINDISIIINKKKYTGNDIPPRTLRYVTDSHNTPVSREHTTIQFPVNLGPLSGASGYICFDVSANVSQMLSTPLIFEVSTNRGNSVRKKLELSEWTEWYSML